jgi:alpha-L-rhamnosidase
MYRVMAGIEIDEKAPGYKHILIQPRPGGGFTRAAASHETPYGKVASAWTLQGQRFELAVEIPPNTRASVRLPRARLTGATESGRPLAKGNGVEDAREEGEDALVEVGSGRYAFAYDMQPAALARR